MDSALIAKYESEIKSQDEANNVLRHDIAELKVQIEEMRKLYNEVLSKVDIIRAGGTREVEEVVQVTKKTRGKSDGEEKKTRKIRSKKTEEPKEDSTEELKETPDEDLNEEIKALSKKDIAENISTQNTVVQKMEDELKPIENDPVACEMPDEDPKKKEKSKKIKQIVKDVSSAVEEKKSKSKKTKPLESLEEEPKEQAAAKNKKKTTSKTKKVKDATSGVSGIEDAEDIEDTKTKKNAADAAGAADTVDAADAADAADTVDLSENNVEDEDTRKKEKTASKKSKNDTKEHELVKKDLELSNKKMDKLTFFKLKFKENPKFFPEITKAVLDTIKANHPEWDSLSASKQQDKLTNEAFHYMKENHADALQEAKKQYIESLIATS